LPILKEIVSRELGAGKFLVWTNKSEMEREKASMDIIINTGIASQFYSYFAQ
jgi:hypothetical protein